MISAKKSLGQHFLRDPGITDKIVLLCGDISALNIIEIGPGPGALTRSILAANPLSYTGIEKDERMLQGLRELSTQHTTQSTFLLTDALKVSLLETVPTPRAVIANLPYNVGTEMLINWLHDIAGTPSPYKFLTLMFQKEVVDRLVAKPNTKDYGRLSILTQWLCEAESLFDLPPSAFSPPPKVTSTVVRLVPRANPESCNLQALEKLTGAAFGQRRKMLRQSVKPLGGEALLEKAGINPTLRAENLTVAEFVKLANLLD